MKTEVDYFKKYLEVKQENYYLKKKVQSVTSELAYEKKHRRLLEAKIEQYKKDEEERINNIVTKAVSEAVSKVKVEYEKIITELKNENDKLKAKLNTDSTNSGIPTSKNRIGKNVIQNNRESTDKLVGGQIGHEAHKLQPFKDEEITKIIEHKLDCCPYCDGELEYINTVKSDIIDVEVNVTKTRNNIYNYKCKNCKKNITANKELPRGVSYGNNINSTALELIVGCNIALNKVESHINGITNGQITMTQGYLSKLESKTSDKLVSFVNELKKKILKLPIVHWDDTVIKLGVSKEENIDKQDNKDKKIKQGIIRFYGNDSYALIIAHKDKSENGIDEDGILQNLDSTCTCVHDHVLLNYNEKYDFKNAECNVHILRYLKRVKESIYDHTWQDKMSQLLNDLNNKRNELISKKINCFDNVVIEEAYKDYRNIIKLGYEENSKTPDYHYYKDEELNLIERLDKYMDNHLLFIKDFNVSFSNNTAERGIRQVKRKLAVSFMFKNLTRAQDYSNILCYTETCYRHSINKFEALNRLLSGNPYTISELENIDKNKEDDN